MPSPIRDDNSSSRPINVLLPLIVSIACVLGMIAGQRMGTKGVSSKMIQKIDSDQQIGIGRIEEVIRFIESKYVEEVDKDKMVEEALTTIMKDLDPHSLYISKARLEEVNNQLKGSYDGLGIETIFYDDTLVVINVIDGSPSDKAGISNFDKIINVGGDNELAGEYDPQVIRSILKGARGSNNELVLKKHNSGLIDTVNVAVGSVNVKSADIAYMLNDSTGYIKIERFNSNIYKEFMESLEKLTTNEGAKHLVVDVRQNPGGYLPETTKILSQFFNEKGKVLVYTEGKSEDRYEYKTTGKVFFEIDKIAVLIDEGSASGSEIIAGAIQDWDRGMIIGRKSYGKGLVQEQYGLSSGDALRLTVAKYYTPSGRSIQKPFRYSEEDSLSTDNDNKDPEEKRAFSEIDTTKYLTKIKKRPVYGGGGITPDITISDDSGINEDALGNVKNLIPEFAYVSLKDKLDEYPDTYAEYLLTDLYKQSMVPDLERYLIDEGVFDKPTLPAAYFARVDQLIKEKIIKIMYDDVSAGKFINQGDAFITEALRSMSKKDIFAELSQEL